MDIIRIIIISSIAMTNEIYNTKSLKILFVTDEGVVFRGTVIKCFP